MVEILILHNGRPDPYFLILIFRPEEVHDKETGEFIYREHYQLF